MVIFKIIWLCLTVVYCEWNEDVHIHPDKYEENDKPFAEFSCTAYLHKEQWLSWYKEKPSASWLTTFQQGSSGGNKTIELILPLESSSRGSEIYCIKQEVKMLSFKTISKSNHIRIDFQKNVPPMERDKPQVTTETVIYESGAPLLEVTCWAYLETKQRLSWYQTKGSNSIFCYKIQDTGYGYMKIILYKVLEPNDIGTQFFCAHETVQYWNGNFEQKSQSRRISISINRPLIDVWGPFINPDPEHTIQSSLIDYTCSAYLYEKELLTWFQVQDSKAPKRLKMIQQSAIYGKIEIKLRKPLEASDIGTQIYCAKEIVHGSIETVLPTKRISIMYRGPLKPVEKPYITIEPEDDIIIFDEYHILKLSCSGSAPVDGRSYTWYIRVPDPQQHLHSFGDLDKTSNSNYLQLKLDQLYHQSLLYCAQDYRLYIATENGYGFSTSCGELARSNAIRLLHRTTGDSEEQPQVTPESFKDQGKPFIKFTCYAFLLPWEVLSWYQSTGSNLSDSLLRTIQLQNSENAQWKKLVLNKTLDRSDNGSNIYCAKQSVMLKGNYSEESRLNSRPILLTFQRDILPLNPYVTTEPKSKVYFEVNSTLSFKCSGSVPVDGRSYTWFRIDVNNTVTIPKNQSYDRSINLNVLELFLNETYHQNKLYCVQGFQWKVRDLNKFHTKFYGEIANSSVVTLVQRGKDADQEMASHFISGTNTMILVVTLPLALVALAAVLILWALRKRRSRPAPNSTQLNNATPETLLGRHAKPEDTGNDESDDGDYVSLTTDMNSTQVTYAVLDLPKKTSNIRGKQPSPSTNIRGAQKTSKARGKTKKSAKGKAKALTSESSHYAEIVGVYTPPKETKPH